MSNSNKSWKTNIVITSIVGLLLFGIYHYIRFLDTRSMMYTDGKENLIETDSLPIQNPFEALFPTGEGTDEITTEDNSTPTYQSIISAYNSKFEALRSDHEEKLSQLIEEGKVEYQEKKGRTLAVMSMANRYLLRMNYLEKQSDAEFHLLLIDFKEALEEYYYDTSIIDDVERYYNSYKNDFKNEMYSKVNKYKMSKKNDQ